MTDKPPEFEIGVQSDFYIDRPPTPLFKPQKLGEDAFTQVEPLDPTFDFDEEVEPMLNVLILKTLEQAQMEVLEEEEMKTMREQQ